MRRRWQHTDRGFEALARQRASLGWVILATALAVGVLVGCARSSRDPVVVRVGGVAIHESVVERKARAIERTSQGAVSAADARRQALNTLITSFWTIGEATEQHLISPSAVTAGQLLESRAKVAARALHEAIARRQVKLAPAEVAAYYRAHLAHLERFYVPERRVTDLIEGIPSQADAEALRHRVGTGVGFRAKALHQIVKRPPSFGEGFRINNALLERIFFTKVGVIAPAVEFNAHWVLVLVRRILPGYSEPLARVRSAVLALMRERRQEEAVKRLGSEFTRRWSARTHCSSGFEVSVCSNYHGPGEPGEGGGELPF